MYQKAYPAGLVGANFGEAPREMQRTALGWPIDPDGLVEILADLRDHYGNPPLYITENGACFADPPSVADFVDDQDRIAYLHQHIAACHRAIAQKVNLRGYFAWTILDNFEWAEGYTARFGLVRVDRASQKRTPKASYHWFAGVAHDNAV
jgi:beta-glucosidase